MGRSLIVIPAHLDSKRLPGKVLLECGRRTLLEHTYRQALQCYHFADVVVATSDDTIAGVVRAFNGICVHTSGVDFPNGTSRAFAAYEWVRDQWDCRHYQSVIVWQADEPCIDPADVYKLAKPNQAYAINTLVATVTADTDIQDTNTVKAILISEDTPVQRVVWFTRHPLIYAFIHVGIYSFYVGSIPKLKELEVHQYAEDESLEQLTWLANNWSVGATQIKSHAPLSINTQDDWDRFTQQ